MEKTNYIQNSEKKRIHYYFLIDSDNHLIPCDGAAHRFLGQIDRDALTSHILGLQFNAATIISTVTLNHVGYSLKIVPVSESTGTAPASAKFVHSNITYIVLLQNQFLFAELLHRIGKYSIHSPEFEDIIKDYEDAIYINDADGNPLYFNSAYLDASDFSPEELIGNTSKHAEKEMFFPVMTPTVMKSNRELTTFQHLKPGRNIITTAIPIYMSNGTYKMVLFLVSPLNHEDIASDHLFDMKMALKSSMQDEILSQSTSIEIIADSPQMRKCMQDAIKISSYDIPCLLLGSSGCGKEVFASLIHATSRRNNGPFVKINCSALPPNLLESELFGYEAGSFTGASNRGKKGFFETCNTGTLLLDEIGDMPLESQAKLLRVLETGEFYKVGGNTPIKVDVRIIAATNKNLREMIKTGTFRSDLYYRLNVASLQLPDLKDRREDITLLINHFTHIFNKKYQTSKVFSKELIRAFEAYPWPGNVRELKNTIERLVLLSSNTVLSLVDIADSEMMLHDDDITSDIIVNGLPRLDDAVDAVERTLVERALAMGSNTRRAAELLDVSQSTIMRKIKKFNLSASE